MVPRLILRKLHLLIALNVLTDVCITTIEVISSSYHMRGEDSRSFCFSPDQSL